jgi:cytochrome P450
MTGFIPAYPKLTLPKSKLLRKLMLPWLAIKSRRCSIAMIPESGYRMKVGEVTGPGGVALFPTDPGTVHRILVEEADDFPKSVAVADTLGLLLGDSIFVSNGDVWKRQRRMMTPAFEHTRVKVVFDMMLEAAKDMLERLDAVADGRTVDVEEEMTLVTADIIFRTIFSRPIGRDEANVIFKAFRIYQEAAFAHVANRAMCLPEWLSFPDFAAGEKNSPDHPRRA